MYVCNLAMYFILCIHNYLSEINLYIKPHEFEANGATQFYKFNVCVMFSLVMLIVLKRIVCSSIRPYIKEFTVQ